MLKKILCLSVGISFFLNLVITPVQARVLLSRDLILPKPGTMVELSRNFKPAILRGIKVNAQDPLKFDFILDPGDFLKRGSLRKGELKQQTTQLIKYFLTTLTIPDNDIWVNLSPYEKDRIITAKFGQTEMGRNLLAQDYLLKQITASLMFPQGETGKKFWARIYKEAQKRFGSTAIPVNTFNKVWIMPDKAVIYEKMQENQATAFVIESSLKVMLEEDYLALKKHNKELSFSNALVGDPEHAKTGFPIKTFGNDNKSRSILSSQIIREVMIPILQKEVNEGSNFAPLRQVYNSIILALWYKQRMQGSILSSTYVNHSKIAGVDIKDKKAAEKIWQRYVQAYKKGVFNFIKEEVSPPFDGEARPAIGGGQGGATVARKYFAGGFVARFAGHGMTVIHDSAMLGRLLKAGVVALGLLLVSVGCGSPNAVVNPGLAPGDAHPQMSDDGSVNPGPMDTNFIRDAEAQLDADLVLPPDAGLPRDIGFPNDAGRPLDADLFDSGPDVGPLDTGILPDGGPEDARILIPDSNVPDSGSRDAGPQDAEPDARLLDSGGRDAGAGLQDTGLPDGGGVDAEESDTGRSDSGIDAGVGDARISDTGSSFDAGINPTTSFSGQYSEGGVNRTFTFSVYPNGVLYYIVQAPSGTEIYDLNPANGGTIHFEQSGGANVTVSAGGASPLDLGQRLLVALLNRYELALTDPGLGSREQILLLEAMHTVVGFISNFVVLSYNGSAPGDDMAVIKVPLTNFLSPFPAHFSFTIIISKNMISITTTDPMGSSKTYNYNLVNFIALVMSTPAGGMSVIIPPPARMDTIIQEYLRDVETLPLSAAQDRASRWARDVILFWGTGWIPRAIDFAMAAKRDHKADQGIAKGKVMHADWERGGIDLTKNSTPLDVRHVGQAVRFHIDPAQIAQINRAAGLTPRVFSIRRLQSLPEFLGLNPQEARQIPF